jgi:hypothetical protein
MIEGDVCAAQHQEGTDAADGMEDDEDELARLMAPTQMSEGEDQDEGGDDVDNSGDGEGADAAAAGETNKYQ